MLEASQSALRVILLIMFTVLFAGLWANDRPHHLLAHKQSPKPSLILAEQTDSLLLAPEELAESTSEADIQFPELEEIATDSTSISLSIAFETEGLTLTDQEIQRHLSQLPLGIADGDYMMVDPHGGVGWVRVRGNRQFDQGETLLTTSIGEEYVRYIRVTPTNVAIEAVKTVR